jgi:predicted Zn finger-like uncharacterized protein
MFTVCPKCALTLVVTAADLRVAQGYVRCGRCSSVFNALAQLADDRQAAAAASAPPPEPAEEPEQQAAPARAGGGSEEAIPEDALEFNPQTTDASSVFVAAAPSPEWTAATGSFKALVAANQEPVTPEPEPSAKQEPGQIDVELDAALLSDVVHPEPVVPRGAASAASAPGKVPAAAPRRPGHERPPQGAATQPAHAASSASQPQPADEAADAEPAALPAEAAPAATRGALKWTIGAALLALVLVVQFIDHRRDILATDPRFNGPLTRLYAALGVQLSPRWDLHAYDVHQLGATVEPGSVGAIIVRASIRNAGVQPQPLPLLRVTLQDRFGNRLASRDVAPGDYLPHSTPPPALLSADQRIDAELAFVDPGASATGFDLDACLPVRGGGVACANDATTR